MCECAASSCKCCVVKRGTAAGWSAAVKKPYPIQCLTAVCTAILSLCAVHHLRTLAAGLLCVSEQALCFFGRVALFSFVSPVVRKEKRAIIHGDMLGVAVGSCGVTPYMYRKKIREEYPDSNLNETKNQDHPRAGSERSFYVAKQIHPNYSLCVGVWTCGEAA